MKTKQHRLVPVMALCLLAAGLVSCTKTGPSAQPTYGFPAPDDAATAFAAALGSGDFSGVKVGQDGPDQAHKDWVELTQGVTGMQPSAKVRSIETTYQAAKAPVSAHLPSATAKAELEVTWSGRGVSWTYTTAVSLYLQTQAIERDQLTGDWFALWRPDTLHPDLEAGDRLEEQRSSPTRGRIINPAGEAIVEDRPVYRIGIDKMKIAPDADLTALARAVAEAVRVDVEQYTQRVLASGPQAFVVALTVRADALENYAVPKDDGVAAYLGTLPLAPTRAFARPLLGEAGEATAEIVEQTKGDVLGGDIVGLSGLQNLYDVQLRGKPGVIIRRWPQVDGAEATTLFEAAGRDGSDVTVTLDLAMQTAAEAALDNITGTAAAVVAIQPSTGQILAAASGLGGNGYPTATLGQYPPGSTFKVVTALALLRAGLEPDSPIECPETVTVDGRKFRNYSDYPATKLGTITLAEAFAYSCNTAFIGQADLIDQAALAQAAQALGIGLPMSLGPGVFEGSVPNSAEGTDHAAALIGQGQVLVAPLDMAVVAASVAAGHRVRPQLVLDPTPQAEVGLYQGPELTEAETGALTELMRLAVTDGSAKALASLPGEIGAKTGTAEYGDARVLQTHAWMIATDGDLAVAVFVEDGLGGAKTAGPILKSFLKQVADQKPL